MIVCQNAFYRIGCINTSCMNWSLKFIYFYASKNEGPLNGGTIFGEMSVKKTSNTHRDDVCKSFWILISSSFDRFPVSILPVGRTFSFCTKFKISLRNNLLTTKWFCPFTLLFPLRDNYIQFLTFLTLKQGQYCQETLLKIPSFAYIKCRCGSNVMFGTWCCDLAWENRTERAVSSLRIVYISVFSIIVHTVLFHHCWSKQYVGRVSHMKLVNNLVYWPLQLLSLYLYTVLLHHCWSKQYLGRLSKTNMNLVNGLVALPSVSLYHYTVLFHHCWS